MQLSAETIVIIMQYFYCTVFYQKNSFHNKTEYMDHFQFYSIQYDQKRMKHFYTLNTLRRYFEFQSLFETSETLKCFNSFCSY